MQNPYEANQNAAENTTATGCGWLIPLGITLALVIAVGGGMLVYRIKVQSAVQREQAMRAMLEAEHARADAERDGKQQAGQATPRGQAVDHGP